MKILFWIVAVSMTLLSIVYAKSSDTEFFLFAFVYPTACGIFFQRWRAKRSTIQRGFMGFLLVNLVYISAWVYNLLARPFPPWIDSVQDYFDGYEPLIFVFQMVVLAAIYWLSFGASRRTSIPTSQ